MENKKAAVNKLQILATKSLQLKREIDAMLDFWKAYGFQNFTLADGATDVGDNPITEEDIAAMDVFSKYSAADIQSAATEMQKFTNWYSATNASPVVRIERVG